LNHPWYRRYYSARNAVQLSKRYGLRFPVVTLSILWTLWQSVMIVFVERDKRAKLHSVLLGFVDGLFGRLGSIEHTRPRFVARMQRARTSTKAT
jgi:rhamnosyltransferase